MITHEEEKFQDSERFDVDDYIRAQNEILIIDDETDFRLDLAELLFTQGFRVITAKNGQEAIEYIQNSKRMPELITLDVKMPEKDGLDFLRELRQINNKIPVIFISGFVRDQEIDSYTSCLEKPLDRLKLFEVIEQMRRNSK